MTLCLQWRPEANHDSANLTPSQSIPESTFPSFQAARFVAYGAGLAAFQISSAFKATSEFDFISARF
jgi:hypothetical protein